MQFLKLSLFLLLGKVFFSTLSQAAPHRVFKNYELSNAPVQGKDGVCGPSVAGTKTPYYEVHRWPPLFTSFLSQELDRFPLKDEVLPHIDAIYLVHTLVDDELRGDAYGRACFNKRTGRFVILLNAQLVADRFVRHAYDAESYADDDNEDGVNSAPGDLALSTFFHELFHVYDLAVLTQAHAKDSRLAIHRSFQDLSWDDTGKPLFIMTRPEASAVKVPTDVLEQYEALKKSNFFSIHATDNPQEDFAYTLEVYYMATRYKQWERHSLKKGATTRHIWDMKALLASSPKHAEKLEFVGKHFFGEDFWDSI